VPADLSTTLTAADNQRRQQALTAELRSRCLAFVDGIGQHPSNGWQEQHGFIWSGTDAVPRLTLLR